MLDWLSDYSQVDTPTSQYKPVNFGSCAGALLAAAAAKPRDEGPLSSELGTCETVKARFRPWACGKNP